MKEFTAACVQIAVTPNDVQANVDKGIAWLEKAVSEYEAELVVFPETATTSFVTGLDAEELWDLVDEAPGSITRDVQAAARSLGVHVVWPSYRRGPERGVIYNSAILIGPDGEIIGIYDKTHPFPLERRDCGGWVTVGNHADVYETALGSIGMIVCYDGDFPELSRLLAVKGAEVIVRPAALLRSFDIWHITNAARAYDNHVYVIATNAVGPDAGGNYYLGHSMIVNPIAWRLAQARGGEEIIAIKLDPDPLRYVTWGSKSLQIFDHLEDRNLELYGEILQEARSRFELGKRIERQDDQSSDSQQGREMRVMEETFQTFLKRGGRSQSAIKRCVAHVKEFEQYLREHQNSKALNEAGFEELESFVAWIESEPKASAKGHLWGLRYYYEYTSNQAMRDLAGELRQQRIKRKPFALKGFRGINSEYVAKLAAVGIANVEQMREAGRTPDSRQELSEKTGVHLEAIVEFVKLSDLARIPGLKSIRARLYYDAGVDTVERLAERDPIELRAMLIAYVERTGFDGIAPLPKEAQGAVAQAKKLPQVVEY